MRIGASTINPTEIKKILALCYKLEKLRWMEKFLKSHNYGKMTQDEIWRNP